MSATSLYADFILEPERVPSGGVATLCWQGSEPPASFTTTFSGSLLPLFSYMGSSCSLVGVDLESSPGTYPLTVRSIDQQGLEHTLHVPLEVYSIERETQKLSLPPQMVTPTKKKILQQIEADSRRLNKIFKQRGVEKFVLPFNPPLQGEVISSFGLRRVLNGIPKSPHNGVDYRAKRGTPVASMNAGTVALAENLYYTGQTVIIDHGGGLFSLYAHLDVLTVTEGQEITTGQIVGRVGSTGRSTAPHLHIGTRIGAIRIDPMALMKLFSHEKH